MERVRGVWRYQQGWEVGGARGGRKVGGKKEAAEPALGNSSYALPFHRTSLYGQDKWTERLRRWLSWESHLVLSHECEDLGSIPSIHIKS